MRYDRGHVKETAFAKMDEPSSGGGRAGGAKLRVSDITKIQIQFALNCNAGCKHAINVRGFAVSWRAAAAGRVWRPSLECGQVTAIHVVMQRRGCFCIRTAHTQLPLWEGTKSTPTRLITHCSISGLIEVKLTDNN